MTLLDPSPRLGGMISGGLSHTDVGDAYAIGGLARSFFLAVSAAYGGNASVPQFDFEPHVGEAILYAMLAEAGVAVVRAAPLVSVERTGAQLSAVRLVDGRTFAGAAFVDGTYDGDLVRAAGVSRTWGRESAAQYGESWAGRKDPFEGPFDFRPIFPLDAQGALLPLLTTRLSAPRGSGDALVQGYNYRLCATTNASNLLPFPPPAAYDAATWELGRRLAAVTAPTFEKWVGLSPAAGGDKHDMNNGCLISTDATGL